MLRTKVSTLLVSLVLSIIVVAQTASAYSIRQAAAGPTGDLVALAKPDQKDRAADKIHKVRPIYKVRPQLVPMAPPWWGISCLPVSRSKGWEVDAQVIFARIKGKVRMCTGNWGGWSGLGACGEVDQDLNSEWGIPDHGVVGSYSLGYRFRPNWAIRYSIMPMELNGSGGTGQNYWYGYGQGAQVKWQRLYQNIVLLYDPILAYRSRVGIFAGYTRLDDKLTFGGTNWSAWGTAPTFDHQLNMGMAGMEFHQDLRTARFRNALSLECRASAAFLDEAFGSDIMTGLRYTIPMGCGRRGYVGGGYRYVNFKKGYNDFKQIDTTLEGGYLKMALIF